MSYASMNRDDDTSQCAQSASVSIGIFAHNEEATIIAVLSGFLKQRTSSAAIDRMVVVCCGCTDRTVPLVRQIIREEARVDLIVRQKREGKLAAINTFLMTVGSDVLVLASGDVIPAPDLVEQLVQPLIADSACAMTGPRVLAWPLPSRRRTVDRLHDMLWGIHHAVSLRSPKLGEIVAFRRMAAPHALPGGVHCDEALLESLVLETGGKLVYVSSALAYNFPPENLRAFYMQRRRIAAQHVLLQRTRGYRPSTTLLRYVVSALWATLSTPRRWRSSIVLLCLLESAAWLHGRWDVSRGRDYRLWRVTRRSPLPDSAAHSAEANSQRQGGGSFGQVDCGDYGGNERGHAARRVTARAGPHRSERRLSRQLPPPNGFGQGSQRGHGGLPDSRARLLWLRELPREPGYRLWRMARRKALTRSACSPESCELPAADRLARPRLHARWRRELMRYRWPCCVAKTGEAEMREHERYLFDLNGYLVVKSALSRAELAVLRDEVASAGLDAALDEHGYLHAGFPAEYYDAGPTGTTEYRYVTGSYLLDWGPAVRSLVAHPRLSAYMTALIGPAYRLDHAYGVFSRGRTAPHALHNGAVPFDPTQMYHVSSGRIYNSMIVVQFALTDVGPGEGGFCCIPGSHKAAFPLPTDLPPLDELDGPWETAVRHVPMTAGDVLIFTEAVTHGATGWNGSGDRIALLYKYCHGALQWERDSPFVTPGHSWTPTQTRVLTGPFAGGRSAVGPAPEG